jgi:chromate reductase, NAD(P)H dehydrogenase (quinone)
MNIIAFAASNSKASINKQFVNFVANQFNHFSAEILDLNDYDLPLFSVDVEKEIGIPDNAKRFYDKLQSADVILISMAEHNGSYTAAFKNLFDWTSRFQLNMFLNKKVFLLSTAPGAMGGRFVLETALNRFPRHGAEIMGQFSLPKFYENFNAENGIINQELKQQFDLVLNDVIQNLTPAPQPPQSSTPQ